jgi:hypothetical protein
MGDDAGSILISNGRWTFLCRSWPNPCSGSIVYIQREPGRRRAPGIPEPAPQKLSSTRESLPRGGSPTRKCGGESCRTKRLEAIWPCAELWDDHGSRRWPASSVPMNSRTDGSITRVHLVRSTTITGRVCPLSRFGPTLPVKDEHSRIPVRNDEVPDLTAVNVTTRPVGQMPEQTGGSQGREEGSRRSGKRWILSEMRERRADKPYIEFDGEQYRISDDSG